MHPLGRVRRPPALGRPRARCAAASGCAAPPRGGRPSGRGRPRPRSGRRLGRWACCGGRRDWAWSEPMQTVQVPLRALRPLRAVGPPVRLGVTDSPRARRRDPGEHRLHRYPGVGGGRCQPRPVQRGRAGRGREPGRAAGPAGLRLRRGGGRDHRRGRVRRPRRRPPGRGGPARAGWTVALPAGRAGGPRRGDRHRRPALRRGAQRHHRLGRAATDPGHAGRREDPRAGQQGVAGRRWRPGHRRREAGPDRRRGLRALRARAGAAGRRARRGRPVDPDRERGTVPWALPRGDARRHAGAGPGAPHLGRWVG